MKLLLVTCIQEYEKEVKDILKHAGVKSFSWQSVKGYSNGSDKNAWFISEEIPTESLLFTVFIENQCMDELFERFNHFNDNQAVNTKIHVACLDVNHSI
ncbi:MAG: hypothetical protein H3C39_02925 [Flavobacteriia bacterium]|nr:hypothetical protein [Flavobacteriia bacterium]